MVMVPRSGEAVIACRGLTKDYGDGHGLFDLDLLVSPGEVFGFIGPNGAGKTTTIRVLATLLDPLAGRVEIDGHDVTVDPEKVRGIIGYLPGELPQFPGVTAGHVIGLLAGLRGGIAPGRIESLAERLELDLSRTYQDLSHGNKQKVGLVQAFMHDPDLLLLDEPTLGLDPLMQREVRGMLAEAAVGGATVLLSSHVLSEVELVCGQIGLIRDGHLLRVGSLEELRSTRVHHIEAIVPGVADVERLAAIPGVSDPRVAGQLVSCSVHGPVSPLLSWLAECDALEIDSRELSLEEVFLTEFGSAP
jgi:ABC-2 type transport system ATP-binding protein